MTKKAEQKGGGKIATFVSSYSNKSTGAGYKNAVETFLRCMYGLTKKDASGKKIEHDYESLFDQYLADKKRNHDADMVKFADCLKAESTSNLSARQIMTLGRRILEDNGAKFKDKTIRDLKREMKGGAGTVDKVLTPKVIEAALKELDLKGRSIVLTLGSSGARLHEVLALKLSDIDFENNPVKLTIRSRMADPTKNKQNRYTFISTEAARCVQVWIAKRDSYLQGSAGRNAGLVRAGRSSEKNTNSDLLFPVSGNAVNAMWETALRQAGLFSQDEQTGRNQYRLHSFRKFFISQFSMAGQKVLAEHLAGHEGYLDGSYRRIDEEAAGKAYLAVQHVVTIGLPPEFRETATELTGKLQLQGESIEGLRIMNEKLMTQMAKMQDDMESMKEMEKRRLDLLEYIDQYPDLLQILKKVVSSEGNTG